MDDFARPKRSDVKTILEPFLPLCHTGRMNIRAFFPNLPVADLPRSVTFFEALGFAMNPTFTNEVAACVTLSDNASVMLLTHRFFGENTPHVISDAHAYTEVLLAIQLESRYQVDAVANAAIGAGATQTRDTQDLSFMYSRSFADLDGHVWEPFWMDPEAMASADAADPDASAHPTPVESPLA